MCPICIIVTPTIPETLIRNSFTLTNARTNQIYYHMKLKGLIHKH